jgi:hypothetical protein
LSRKADALQALCGFLAVHGLDILACLGDPKHK